MAMSKMLTDVQKLAAGCFSMTDVMVPSRCFSPKTTMLWRIERTAPQLLSYPASLL